jgi:hypothetical protein
MDAKCTLDRQGLEDALSLDLVLPAGANSNLKMAGPTLQAMGALLNQLREHAQWGEVPQVIEANLVKQDAVTESKKPSIH